MLLAIDVHYKDTRGQVVGVLFETWHDEKPVEVIRFVRENIAEYEPGAFYKRELPCILELLDKISLPPEIIIIDGYVYLDNEQKPGLGIHLYESINRSIPVIGVAKTRFHNNEHVVQEIVRGESNNPLFISAVGIPLTDAAQNIKQMHGEFRIPTLLKLLDTETKRWA